MKKDKINFIASIIVLLNPFLGFPNIIKNSIFVVCGLIVLIISLREIRRVYKLQSREEKTDAFVESKPIKSFEGGQVLNILNNPDSIKVDDIKDQIENNANDKAEVLQNKSVKRRERKPRIVEPSINSSHIADA